jgi:hypothetical protein
MVATTQANSIVPTNAQLVAHIASGLGELNSAQLALMDRYLCAMRRPMQSWARPDSDIATPSFAWAAGHYLSLHHATQRAALNKKGFEFLFQFACAAAGKKAILNLNTTDANADVFVNGVGFSLKTQADKAAKRGTLYIQKLMEARWFRDLNTPQEIHEFGVLNILNHLSRYERILVLKAYPEAEAKITYELVEIRKSVFNLLSQVAVTEFPVKNSKGGCSISVRDDEGEAFRLAFDGSVEKIRIFNLRDRNCISHAEWTVPVHYDDDS